MTSFARCFQYGVIHIGLYILLYYYTYWVIHIETCQQTSSHKNMN